MVTALVLDFIFLELSNAQLRSLPYLRTSRLYEYSFDNGRALPYLP